MKTKLELAHEWAMRIGPETNLPLDILADACFDYAEAMLAENARRDQAYLLTKDENGNCLHIHTTLNRGECFDCGERLDEFEIDWRIAPAGYDTWVMDEDGRANWYFEYPVINEKYSAFFLNNNSSRFRKAPSFNYTGDWKESLRRRPE